MTELLAGRVHPLPRPLKVLLPFRHLLCILIFSFIMALTLKVITFNVHGFRNPQKQAEIINIARSASCDLLFLQETNFFKLSDVLTFKRAFNIDCYFSFASTRSTGVGVIVFNRSLLRDHHVTFDAFGRVLAFDCTFFSLRIRFVGVYGPAVSANSAAFFRSLDTYLLNSRHLVLLGDFNCVLDSHTDVRGPGRGRSNWNAKELERLVQQLSLTDVYDRTYGGRYVYTWRRATSSSRLDRAYVSPSLMAFVRDVEVLSLPPTPVYISDHRPVALTLHLPAGTPAVQRPWRLDCRVLQDFQTAQGLSRALHASLIGANLTDWDHLKEQWRHHCSASGRALRARVTQDANVLMQKIRIAHRDPCPSPVMRAWQAELVDRYQRIMRASSLSAAAWRCRRAPCAHPEVLRYARRALIRPCGSPAHTLRPIAPAPTGSRDFQAFTRHFEFMAQSATSVSSAAGGSLHSLLQDLPRYSNADSDTLLSPPSDSEIKDALNAMKKGSAPGPDGLPVEFYIEFWPIIGPFMSRVIRRCFHDLSLPHSFRSGRITLIPKKDSQSMRPEDWRPITLLNADYKLLANILVRRISPSLPSLIAPHQVCSIPGRDIHSHTWLTRDIIQYTTGRCAQGLLVSLDQEKAFDFVEHAYLFNVLQSFGFPDKFIRLIRAMYANSESTLFLDSRESRPFQVTRGVRQGCPLSPVLFVLALEPFLKAIERHPQIRGLPLPGRTEVKVTAYADDITLYIHNEQSLQHVLNAFSHFGGISGARLNLSKSQYF